MNFIVIDKKRLYSKFPTNGVDVGFGILNHDTYVNMDFVIVLDGPDLYYLKCRAANVDFPFEVDKKYPASRIATHLLHINDWYAKQ